MNERLDAIAHEMQGTFKRLPPVKERFDWNGLSICILVGVFIYLTELFIRSLVQ